MEEWGNKRANEYFEANVPASVVKPKEGDPVRVVERYIRDKYEHRRYVASAIPPKSAAAVAEPEEAPARRASTTTKPAPRATNPVPAAPVPVAVAPSKPAAVPDLLNLMDDPTPAPAPAAAPAFPPAAPSTDFGDFTSAGVAPTSAGFSAFDSPAPKSAPVAAGGGDFMDFMTAPAPAVQAAAPAPQFSHDGFAPQQSAAPAKPQASADAILSLYASNMNRAGPVGMMPSGNGMMGPNGNTGFPNHGMQPNPMMGMHAPQHSQGHPYMMGGHAQPMMQQQGYNGVPQMGMMNHQQPHQGFGGPQGFPQQQAPVNPFMNNQFQQQNQMGGMGMGMGMGGGYPQQQHQQQPPVNPFRPTGAAPAPQQAYGNMQFQQPTWQPR